MNKLLALGLLLLAGPPVQAAEVATKPSASEPLARPDTWWTDRHAQYRQAGSEEKWQVVFIGDSITEGWANAGKEVWDKYYAPRKTGNLGISGDETRHLLWRIENGELAGQTPKLIVLKIGTNNLGNVKDTPEEVIDGVKAVVKLLTKTCPQSEILLLGVLPRGEQPDDPYREQIRTVNAGIRECAEWERVHFLDLTDKFLEADGKISKDVMPDFLHLTPRGYTMWAEAMEAQIADLMGE